MMMMTRQNKMMKEKEAEFQQTIKKLTQQNMMMKEKESEFQQIIKELTQENKMMKEKEAKAASASTKIRNSSLSIMIRYRTYSNVQR
jgi:predicted RNase H-like nuclease (RuvC/YqgF family)